MKMKTTTYKLIVKLSTLFLYGVLLSRFDVSDRIDVYKQKGLTTRLLAGWLVDTTTPSIKK